MDRCGIAPRHFRLQDIQTSSILDRTLFTCIAERYHSRLTTIAPSPVSFTQWSVIPQAALLQLSRKFPAEALPYFLCAV
jgi:hypothetical protein